MDVFSLALRMALLTGSCVSLLVFLVPAQVDAAVYTTAKFLGFPGNDIFLIGASLLIMIWGWRNNLRSLVVLVLWSDLVVGVVVQGIKFLLKTEVWHLRPDGGYGGFPSGHATHAFAMAMLLTAFFPRLRWLWFILAAAISWSRVVTQAHYAEQVVAGVMLGTALGWLFLQQWLWNPEGRWFKQTADELETE